MLIAIRYYDRHTHGAVADVPVVGGSDGRLHVRFLQGTVGKPHMEGEEATPAEDAVTTSKHCCSKV